MMMRLSVAVLLLATVAACGSSPDNSTPPAPPYVVVSEENRLIRIEVDTLLDESGLRATFDAERAKSRPDGGYFVQINCSTGGTDNADNRLANGRFAVGRLGAAQVGLEEGAAEFEVVTDRACPDEVAIPPANDRFPPEPDAATVQSYVTALDAIDPRIVDGKPERAVDRGRNQCSSIKQFPGDQAKLVDLTRQRFSTSVDFGPDAATSILVAVRKYICPTY